MRDATLDDLSAVVAMLADDDLGSGREVASAEIPQPYTTAFNKLTNDPNHRLIIAELNGEIVGTFHLSLPAFTIRPNNDQPARHEHQTQTPLPIEQPPQFANKYQVFSESDAPPDAIVALLSAEICEQIASNDKLVLKATRIDYSSIINTPRMIYLTEARSETKQSLYLNCLS